nr:uncharacterized protein LOC109410797 [Aedes albopictus]
MTPNQLEHSSRRNRSQEARSSGLTGKERNRRDRTFPCQYTTTSKNGIPGGSSTGMQLHRSTSCFQHGIVQSSICGEAGTWYIIRCDGGPWQQITQQQNAG